MQFSRLPYLILLWIFINPQRLCAQPSLHYIEKLTTTQGLSSNRTSDVVQDSRGFLWVGTAHGLNRYDGTEFTHYFAGTDNKSITDNIVHRMVRLDSFRIAIATHHGLSILDTRVDTFRHIFFQTAWPGADTVWEPYENMITFLEKDKKGNLWAGTPISIYRMGPDFKIQKVFRANYNVSDLRKERLYYVSKILPLESGNVLFWLKNKNDIFVWQPSTSSNETDTLISIRQWEKGRYSFLNKSPSNHCFQVYKHYLIYLKLNTDSLYVYDEQTGRKAVCFFPDYDPEHINWHQRFSPLGEGWLAFSFELKGLSLVKLNDEDQQLSIHYNPEIYFPDHTFRRMMKDREGNRWITTDVNGLLKISRDKQFFHAKSLIDPNTGLESRFEISSFYRFRNSLFIASYGNGLYEWNLPSGKLEHYSIRSHEFSENMAWNIRHEQGDTLWIGTQHGLLWYHVNNHQHGYLNQPHPKVLDSFTITTQFVDSKGLVWMGLGAGHGLCRYDPVRKKFHVYPNGPDTYPFRYPIAVAEDQASNLWFLSDNVSDLVRWNRANGKFKIIPVNQFEEKGYKFIGGFYIDKKENIWYGLESTGLVCYNIKSQKIKTYGADYGLNTDLILSIMEDTSGRLWMATPQGVSCFYPEIQRFVNYGPDEGLPASNCSANFYYDSMTKRIYAGAPGKVIYFSPQNFHPVNNPMRVQLTAILVNNNLMPFPQGGKLHLSYQNNDLDLQFTGINLTNGAENRYAYKLGNNKWVDIGNQRQIHFASLSPGNYNFSIRAARTGEAWSPVTEHLRITIRPPFTRTVWFYLLLLLAAGGIIYAWYRYRLMQLMKLEKIRSRISHDLHDEIGSRLTSISLLSLLARQKATHQPEIAHLLKRINLNSIKVSSSMREIIWGVNPKNDFLSEIIPRLIQYASEMLETKNIVLSTKLPSGLDHLKFSMQERHDFELIFKEAVHNIAKHSCADKVEIILTVEKKKLHLIIQDNGKGINREKITQGTGLHSMQKRAEQHHWQFNIEPGLEKGTEINLLAVARSK